MYLKPERDNFPKMARRNEVDQDRIIPENVSP